MKSRNSNNSRAATTVVYYHILYLFWLQCFCFLTVLKKFQSREDLNLNGTLGHSIVLPCQPPISSPEANILFELNGTIISTSSGKQKMAYSNINKAF